VREQQAGLLVQDCVQSASSKVRLDSLLAPKDPLKSLAEHSSCTGALCLENGGLLAGIEMTSDAVAHAVALTEAVLVEPRGGMAGRGRRDIGLVGCEARAGSTGGGTRGAGAAVGGQRPGRAGDGAGTLRGGRTAWAAARGAAKGAGEGDQPAIAIKKEQVAARPEDLGDEETAAAATA
jgi:hypothetical protein